MKLALPFIVLALTSFMTGCATYNAKVRMPLVEASRPDPNTATIVFFRPKDDAPSVSAPIIKSTPPEELDFVGVLTANNIVIDKTTPDDHDYILGGRGQNRLRAHVKPGRVYVIQIKPYKVKWAMGFTFEPQRVLSKT